MKPVGGRKGKYGRQTRSRGAEIMKKLETVIKERNYEYENKYKRPRQRKGKQGKKRKINKCKYINGESEKWAKKAVWMYEMKEK